MQEDYLVCKRFHSCYMRLFRLPVDLKVVGRYIRHHRHRR
jgi:hypothetical protein